MLNVFSLPVIHKFLGVSKPSMNHYVSYDLNNISGNVSGFIVKSTTSNCPSVDTNYFYFRQYINDPFGGKVQHCYTYGGNAGSNILYYRMYRWDATSWTEWKKVSTS